MNKNERISMIVELSRKILMYPKGSTGYDSSDAIRLQDAINLYDREKPENDEKDRIAENCQKAMTNIAFFAAERIVTPTNRSFCTKELITTDRVIIWHIDNLENILTATSPFIDELIHLTPSGEHRNSICDLNIKIKELLSKK